MVDPVTAVPTPWENIALGLSGGGFRAAAFHLGTLDLLHRVGLLSQVTVLSTVSGGTFTGAGYALALARHQDFSAFFGQFFNFLLANGTLQTTLGYLSRGSPPTPAARRNLITSAAQAYADGLFGDRFQVILDTETHLKEITFNATEFATGLSFRFQKSQNPHTVIGNHNFPVPRAIAEEIRLADIVAASSCFPGGFEPIAFPDDFHWPAASGQPNVRPLLPKQFQLPLPLMDGGVYDNQGIDSLLLASERKGAAIDLFIISDTNQPQDLLFHMPSGGRKGGLTLGRAAGLVDAVIGLSGLTALLLIGHAVYSSVLEGFHLLEAVIFEGLPLLFTLLVGLSLLWTRNLVVEKLARLAPQLGIDLWPTLQQLTVAQAVDMAEVRGRSLLALTANVFLKRVRQLVYDKVYKEERNNNRVLPNMIYRLGSKTAREKAVPEWLSPSAGMQRLADEATAVATALWFDDATPLPGLVACGQGTMCHNLLRHIVRTYGAEAAMYPPEVAKVFEQLRAIWQDLQSDPLKLLNEWLRSRQESTA